MQASVRQDGVHPGDASGILVVLTRVEGLLHAEGDCSCEVPHDALRTLAACGVPLVFVSESPAHVVRQLQNELGVTAPFICGRGAALHVPSDAPDGLSGEVFQFDPPDVMAAVTLPNSS